MSSTVDDGLGSVNLLTLDTGEALENGNDAFFEVLDEALVAPLVVEAAELVAQPAAEDGLVPLVDTTLVTDMSDSADGGTDPLGAQTQHSGGPVLPQTKKMTLGIPADALPAQSRSEVNDATTMSPTTEQRGINSAPEAERRADVVATSEINESHVTLDELAFTRRLQRPREFVDGQESHSENRSSQLENVSMPSDAEQDLRNPAQPEPLYPFNQRVVSMLPSGGTQNGGDTRLTTTRGSSERLGTQPVRRPDTVDAPTYKPQHESLSPLLPDVRGHDAGLSKVEGPSDVVMQLASRLASRFDPSGRLPARLQVELDPPELGRLVVELTDSPQGILARITTSRESTAVLVDHQVTQLKQSLHESGIEVHEFQVNDGLANSDSGPNRGHSRDEPESSWSGGKRRDAKSKETIEPADRRPAADGRIDVSV